MLSSETRKAATLATQGAGYFREPSPGPELWMVGFAAIAAGALLLVGLLTPVVCGAVAVGALGCGLSLVPVCTRTLFGDSLSIVFGATILIALLILGPVYFLVTMAFYRLVLEFFMVTFRIYEELHLIRRRGDPLP